VRGARAAARAPRRWADYGLLRGAGARRIGAARGAGRDGAGQHAGRVAAEGRAEEQERRASFQLTNFIIVCWHLGRWGAGAAARADRLPRAPRRRCRKQHNKSHKNASKQRRQAGAPRLRRHPRPPVLQRCAPARGMASGGGGSPAAAESASPVPAEGVEAAAPASTPARRGSGGLAALDATTAGSSPAAPGSGAAAVAAASTPLPHPLVARSDSLGSRPEWLPSPEVVEQRTKPLKTFFVRPGHARTCLLRPTARATLRSVRARVC
jgi:hypothetical protein